MAKKTVTLKKAAAPAKKPVKATSVKKSKRGC